MIKKPTKFWVFIYDEKMRFDTRRGAQDAYLIHLGFLFFSISEFSE